MLHESGNRETKATLLYVIEDKVVMRSEPSKLLNLGSTLRMRYPFAD
jgi:hypothetical protein